MKKSIKLVIWDLDDTLWKGTIGQDSLVQLQSNILNIIRSLDERGILQSICSKNDHDIAMKQLQKFSLDEYFIYPMINWNHKSWNIKHIIEQINIGEDTVAFIDDQEYERSEVSFHLPKVTCISAQDIPFLLEREDMNPMFVTEDSKQRRKLYQNDIRRKNAEEAFLGDTNDFLMSLNMEMTIRPAKEKHLQRAEELTVRTHQLNSTGYTYSYDELKDFIDNDIYRLLVVDLCDKFGQYGTVGLALIECQDTKWIIKLLITSCRVINRGIGTALISYIINQAKENNKQIFAEFIETERNRIMGITYSMMYFHPVEVQNGNKLLQYTKDEKCALPDYLNIKYSQ